MRISIAMATYNGANYLQDQLDSFLYQTRPPDELVVCDDGSTDETLSLLETFRAQAPFAVHIHRNEARLGYAKNFERALSLCTGDIIFLSDQDDVWFCRKIAEVERIFQVRQTAFVVQADMVLADQAMQPTGHTQLSNILAIGLGSASYVWGCGSALRRSFLDLALPFPVDGTGHDNWIHRLALALEVRILHPVPLQYYRRHGANASAGLASNPRRLSRLDGLRAHGLRSAQSGWLAEHRRVQAAHRRIGQSADILERLRLSDRQQQAQQLLLYRMKAIESRIDCVGLPRLRRLPRVLALWMQGTYAHHAGWRSAFKDILRP